MKQTSIEWLLTWMTKNQYFIGNDLLAAFEVAEEMHKKEMTPIELPSDEDIEEESNKLYYGTNFKQVFSVGAKWMKEQILNQNK